MMKLKIYLTPDISSKATMKLIFLFAIRLIAMIFDTDIHVTFMMICNRVGHPLTLTLAPSSGQTFNLSNTYQQNQWHFHQEIAV